MHDDTHDTTVPTAALAEHATELTTTDPTAPLDDLAPVLDSLADARVIGLGEATHGTREFFELKHRIVRGLVEEQGLRLFAIEANLPETLAMNEYVLHGKGDPRDALDGMYFWTWNTDSVLAFAEWLREFNEGRPFADRVRFHGIDTQFTHSAITRLDGFLADVAPELHADLREDLRLADDGETGTDPPEGTETLCGAADRLVARLERAFADGPLAGVNAPLERRCVWLLDRVAAYKRAVELDEDYPEAGRIRDAAMAETVAWLFDFEGRDRVAVWAHDAHLGRIETRTIDGADGGQSLGHRLADRYGDDYRAIGFDFLEGEFRAIGVGLDEGELSGWELDAPPEGSVTDALAATGHDIAYLDLRAADEWFERPRYKRELGAVYYGPEGPDDDEDDGLEAHNEKRVLPETFDGLLFVRETTATRPPE